MGLGLNRAHVFACDSKGLIYDGRGEYNPEKARYAQKTHLRTLADAMPGADVFLGCSTGGVLTQDMVRGMADKPIILALANPEPEIRPELAQAARPDCIMATGRSDYPNQVNNVLCFPYIFRERSTRAPRRSPGDEARLRAGNRRSGQGRDQRGSGERLRRPGSRPSAPTTSFRSPSIRG